jgi:hypothetical protein
MLLTPHIVVGATIAILYPHPFVAMPVSFASHYILDMVPHWQETMYPYKPHLGTWLRIPIDIGLSILLVYIITHYFPQHAVLITVCALLAVLPDLDALFIFNRACLRKGTWSRKLWDFDCKIQNETKSWLGVLTQVVVILGCFYTLTLLVR